MTDAASEGEELDAELPDFFGEDEHEPTQIAEVDERRFGRFDLCFELAAGGMATVFLARSVGPGGFEKLVALKRIHPHLAKQKKFVDMFLDEARIASRISHPNVCSVVDFGETGGTYYLAMDYLLGEPLSRALRALAKTEDAEVKKKLPLVAARIIADAAEGLHAAHELRGSSGQLLEVVHRDVSPHNIFVTYEGGVSIVDFGIATAADRTTQTRTGTVKGKYAYIAPEQVHSQKVDRRADVWSLGVVLWEMLTQRRLFKRKNEAETLLAVSGGPIPPPSRIKSNVPEAIDAVVLRALSRDREKRYETAREMSRDLLRALGKAEDPVGMGEISEFLHALFPGGEARKRQLIELAEQTDQVPKVHQGAGSTEDSLSAHGSQSQASQASMVREVPGLQPLLASRKVPWIIAGGSLTLLLVIAIVAFSGGDGRDGPVAVASGAATGTTMSTAAAPAIPTAMVEPAMVEPAMVETAVTETATAETATTETATTETATTETATTETAMTETTTTETAMTTKRTTRPRPPRTPPPPSRPGLVNVSTPGGWAEVWFRGSKVGQSPGRITLPAGRQRIQLRPFGRSPYVNRTVNVRSGQTVRISVPLR